MTPLTKPDTPRAIHLFAVSFLWTASGGLLVARGWKWLDPGQCGLLFFVASLLGILKSLLVLDKFTRRSVERILCLQDGVCLGTICFWKTWLLVLLMIIAGIALRHLMQPGSFIGVLYCAVGCSLCLSSRLSWQAWHHHLRHHEIA